MTQLVEVVLTTDQAAVLAAASDVTLRAASESEYIALEEGEQQTLEQLAVFLAAVANNPQHFPVASNKGLTLKKRLAAPKGAGQPQSRKNKRKARQERRMSFHKRRRKERRADAENFNQAREIVERDRAEMEEIQRERQAQLENEPKFEMLDSMGNVVLSGIPESMIRPQQTPDTPEEEAPKIIMPGSAEALGLE